ncbi:MAG: gamma-glutamyl-gamma-aminobutyrate hydrolase family protein [Bacteriovoracaceae bacterium]|nr:gamma-glutamyl-gamma-aminobutyrate hydrolase family protein [Bacteriovoracaceae bacterium]
MKDPHMIAFIDPFLKSPAAHCFNDLAATYNKSFAYYMPDKFGVETLKEDAPRIKAYFVAGSASNVTEPLDWHDDLAKFLLMELKQNKPILAVCFGHQLLCHALGSVVQNVHDNGDKITGTRKITVTEDFWNYKKGTSFTLPVSHKQMVKKLGPDLVSVGQGLENDIVIHKTLPLLSTQAHPEASTFFCRQEIKILGPVDEKAGRIDGQRFIHLFFQHFEI